MRKLVATIFTILFITSSANSFEMPSVTIGVSGLTGAWAGTGTQQEYSETGTSPVTTKEYGAFTADYATVMLELGLNDSISLGVEYALGDIDTPENRNESSSATPTSRVRGTIKDYTTVYSLIRIPLGGLYTKLGVSHMDVISKENQRSGNTYGNDKSTGYVFGLGYEFETAAGIGIRAELNAANFDSVEFNNGQTNKNTVNIDDMFGGTARIALVKSF